MKKILIVSIILIFILFLILFGNFLLKTNKIKINNYKIGFVISSIGDKGFVDMQVEGVKKAAKLYNLKYKLYITGTYEAIKDGILNAIDEGCNIIICGNGFLAEKSLMELAPENPKIYFICMDTEFSKYPINVATVSFKQNEGSFLVGVLAAKITRTKSLGFIGGMNIPVINDFFVGFQQGIKYIDKSIKIYKRFVDEISKNDPFQDIEAGEKIADEMIKNDNVDIIYSVAGKTNLGIYFSIQKNNIFSIGVDTDQDYLAKGKILTSMIKKLDIGIIYIIDKILNNSFTNKNFRIGLKENGVSLSEMIYTKEIIGNDLIMLLEQLKIQIIEEKIIVDSCYKRSEE